MKVSYNGFTGPLVKLERSTVMHCSLGDGAIPVPGPVYLEKDHTLCIYDAENLSVRSFTGVKMEDVKFLGGEVSFR